MVARLSMWNASLGTPGKGRGTDVSNFVRFYAAAQASVIPGGIPYVDIVDISHATPGRKINRLLVKYSNGLFVLDNPSREDGEVVEDFLTLDVADLAEAQRLAQRHFDEVTSGELAITVTLQPYGPYGNGGDIPYVHFSPGDWVTALAEDLTPTRYRVMAITISGDDIGNASVIVELNRRMFSAEQERISLLKTLGSGEVGKVSTSEQVTGYVGSGD